MKSAILGALTALGMGAAVAAAGSDCNSVDCGPTETFKNVTLWHQPNPPSPECLPPQKLPAGVVFMRVQPPTVCLPPMPPPPPGHLFRELPRPIHTFGTEPVQVTLFRRAPEPPAWTHVPVPPAGKVFMVIPPDSPRCLPPETMPPGKAYRQLTPGCMECPPTFVDGCSIRISN